MSTDLYSDQSETRTYAVVIVGAGLSGLQCARDLIASGLSSEQVLILEAQEYVGGRLRADSSFIPGGSIDLGAEFIHGGGTLLYETAVQQQLPIVDLYCWAHGDGGPLEHDVEGGYGLYYYADSNRIVRFDDVEDTDFVKTNESLFKIMHLNPAEHSDEESLSYYYAQCGFTPAMIQMADAGYANTLCSNGSSLSLKQMIHWNRVWGEDEQNMRFKNGFHGVVQYLQQGLNIKTNTPVTLVQYGVSSDQVLAAASTTTAATTTAATRTISTAATTDDSCQVITAAGECYHAQRVVVTASAHVIRQQLLSFQPPLPAAVSAAFESIDMHVACKVLLLFNERPWPEKLQGMVCAGTAVPEFWFRDVAVAVDSSSSNSSSDSGSDSNSRSDDANTMYLATGFVTAGFAEALLSLGDESVVVQTALRQLELMMSQLQPQHLSASPSLPPPPQQQQQLQQQLPLPSAVFVRGKVYEWSPRTHPHIGGGYGSARAGRDVDYARILAAPISSNHHSSSYNISSGSSSNNNNNSSSNSSSNGRLFFAGEAVALGAGATACAAMKSGRDTAALVTASLKR